MTLPKIESWQTAVVAAVLTVSVTLLIALGKLPVDALLTLVAWFVRSPFSDTAPKKADAS